MSAAAKLNISDQLSLPIDFVTQTQAILAKRGVGKSYCASVQAEELLAAKQQVIVVDPTGAWFGLRSSADGKHEGFPIVVMGGEHADVPLEKDAGELIASAIVERRFSAVLDLSLFRKGQMTVFMGAFLEALYRLNREAVHLFVDEADAIAPQKPFGEEARTLGAMEDVIRRGRRRGIGCTVITQRPAVINKNVLTQCEILCALRMGHPLDIKAVMEWVGVHGDPDTAKEMITSLPSLPVGNAWFWWPTGDLFKRVQIRHRITFDSGATPKAGQKIKPPSVLAPVDIEQLGASIKATVERVKENDPRELKRRIADLQKQLSARPSAKPIEKIVEKPVVSEKLARDVERIVARLEKDADRRIDMAAKMVESADGLRASGEQLKATGREFASALRGASARPPMAQPAPRAIPEIPPKAAKPATEHEGVVTGPEQRILNSIAWLESIGVPEPDQTAVAFLAGYTYGGGGFNNPRGALNTKGLVAYLSGGRIKLTDEGRALAQAPDEPLTTEGLHEKVCAVLPGPEQRILRPLLKAYPDAMSNEDLAAASGYTNGSGGYNNPRGRLRTLGLIEYRDGGVVARDILFPSEIAR